MKRSIPSSDGTKHSGWGMRLLMAAGLLVAVLTFIGTFIGEIRWVPTASMEGTIMARSIVWMDKTRYGARMPRRFWDIPVLKFGFYIVPQLYRPDQRLDWGYHRMKGLGMPERGDIIAFESPLGDNVVMCKRLIGLPGDTIEMRHGEAYVNGVRLVLPPTVRSTIEADTVFVFAYSPRPDWNTHSFGPIVVPTDEAGPCYFVLGDNRRHSQDSRVWGFVRHRNIVGRVIAL